jgi:hypothetical protein
MVAEAILSLVMLTPTLRDRGSTASSDCSNKKIDFQLVVKKRKSFSRKATESFRGLTGIPMVLNTSFNENQFVVCKPQEALDCFYDKTGPVSGYCETSGAK